MADIIKIDENVGTLIRCITKVAKKQPMANV